MPKMGELFLPTALCQLPFANWFFAGSMFRFFGRRREGVLLSRKAGLKMLRILYEALFSLLIALCQLPIANCQLIL
jgi:hypothetical protein